MKIISWNVAGINACIKKGLLEFIKNEDADAYCFQEVKSSEEKARNLFDELKNYKPYYLFGDKKGYSGVLTLSKTKPLSVIEGIGVQEFNKEGRVLTLEFPRFFLANAYFPHSHRELTRLDFKLKFNNAFLNFCKNLEKQKPLIIAADFNVAHKEIDLANPKQNQKNAGFTKEEREWFDFFLKQGFLDSFRKFNQEEGNYTWWTYRNNARERNIGWRIDYFVVSNSLKSNLTSSKILKDVRGSDHCPISIEIKI
jgi:exodeoxyribonuclease III